MSTTAPPGARREPYTDKGNVNRWASGWAVDRCVRAMLAGEIDRNAWCVFIVMATVLSTKEQNHADPVCWAGHKRIGDRCGIRSRQTVAAAIKRLVELGWLIRVGKATVTNEDGSKAETVKYRVILKTDVCSQIEHKGEPDAVCSGIEHKGCSPDEHKGCSIPEHKSKSSSGSAKQATKEDDDRATAIADGPGGPPLAAPSTGASPKSGIYAEIAECRGCSLAEAERWAGRKIEGAGVPVRNEVAYLRRCLDNEQATDVTPASGGRSARKATAGSGKKPAAGVPSAAQRKAALNRRRPRNTFSAEEIVDAVAASRSGEAHAAIAERLNVVSDAVDCWRRDADQTDAEAAVCEGQPIDQVAERFGLTAEEVRVRHQRLVRRDVLTGVQAGEPTESLAGKFVVDAEFVEQVRADETERAELLARQDRVRPDVVAELAEGSPVALIVAKYKVPDQFVRQVQRAEAKRRDHEQKVRGDIVNALNRGEPVELIARAFEVDAEFVVGVRQHGEEQARVRAEWEAKQEAARQAELERRNQRKAEERKQRETASKWVDELFAEGLATSAPARAIADARRCSCGEIDCRKHPW